MLVLSRKPGERIVIGKGADQVELEIIRVRGTTVTLGFVARVDLQIMREELLQRAKRGGGQEIRHENL
jgi:carbon storage regulator CsrA